MCLLQLGISTLSTISQSCADQLCPHLDTLLRLFGALLGSASPAVHYHVILAMTNLTPALGSDQLVSSLPSTAALCHLRTPSVTGSPGTAAASPVPRHSVTSGHFQSQAAHVLPSKDQESVCQWMFLLLSMAVCNGH